MRQLGAAPRSAPAPAPRSSPRSTSTEHDLQCCTRWRTTRALVEEAGHLCPRSAPCFLVCDLVRVALGTGVGVRVPDLLGEGRQGLRLALRVGRMEVGLACPA